MTNRVAVMALTVAETVMGAWFADVVSPTLFPDAAIAPVALLGC
jgi:hypothetical protein